VVSPPPGLADPFSVAPLAERLVTAAVDTDGSATAVVNDSTAPNEVPNEFWAMAQ